MFENRQLEVIDSYLSLENLNISDKSSQLNTVLGEGKPDVRSQYKLDFFLHHAGFNEDVEQSPNSTSKSDLNLLKATKETAEALGSDRMLKLVNSGLWGQALSKLYGGTWAKLFFPEKAQYNKGS